MTPVLHNTKPAAPNFLQLVSPQSRSPLAGRNWLQPIPSIPRTTSTPQALSTRQKAATFQPKRTRTPATAYGPRPCPLIRNNTTRQAAIRPPKKSGNKKKQQQQLPTARRELGKGKLSGFGKSESFRGSAPGGGAADGVGGDGRGGRRSVLRQGLDMEPDPVRGMGLNGLWIRLWAFISLQIGLRYPTYLMGVGGSE